MTRVLWVRLYVAVWVCRGLFGCFNDLEQVVWCDGLTSEAGQCADELCQCRSRDILSALATNQGVKVWG